MRLEHHKLIMKIRYNPIQPLGSVTLNPVNDHLDEPNQGQYLLSTSPQPSIITLDIFRVKLVKMVDHLPNRPARRGLTSGLLSARNRRLVFLVHLTKEVQICLVQALHGS